MLLLSEFEGMTGIFPPTNLFAVIQEYFEKSRLTKQEFCRRYSLNIGRLAEIIQQEANMRECYVAYRYGKLSGKARAKSASES